MMMARLAPGLSLVALLALVACGGTSSTAPPDEPHVSLGSRPRRAPGETELRDTWGKVERRAVVATLEPAPGAPSSAPARFKLIELEPATPAPSEPDVRWIFRHWDDADLVLADGRVIEHPDRARAVELAALLERSPPEVPQLVAGLPALLRVQRRAALLARAASIKELDAAARTALVDAATAPRGALLAETPDGLFPGGATGSALHEALAALVARTDLAPEQDDRLALAAPAIGGDFTSQTRAQALLEALVARGGGSTIVILSAVSKLVYSGPRHGVLLALARKRGAADRDVDAIARAAPTIGSDFGSTVQAQAVLEELVARGGATTGALLQAYGPLAYSGPRHAVLLAMAKARGDRAGEADAIARLAPSIGSDFSSQVQAQAVLEELIRRGGVTTAAALHAASQLVYSGPRHGVLRALALARGDGDAADAIARAAPAIGHDFTSQTQAGDVLVRLVRGSATTATLVEAASKLVYSGPRHAVLHSLATNRGAAGADAIARAAPSIGSDFASQVQAQAVLEALVERGGATIGTVLRAVAQLNCSGPRHGVLHALARKVAQPGDADAVADAAPSIGSDFTSQTQAGAVLCALVRPGGATTAAIVKAALTLGYTGPRGDVLDALAAARGADAADADAIVAACPSIGQDFPSANKAASILERLVARGAVSVKVVLAAAARLSYTPPRVQLVRALAARKPLAESDANAIAAAAASIDDANAQAEVLLGLVGKATPRVLLEAAKGLRSEAAKNRVLEKLVEAAPR